VVLIEAGFKLAPYLDADEGSQIQVMSLIKAGEGVWRHCSNTSRELLLEEIVKYGTYFPLLFDITVRRLFILVKLRTRFYGAVTAYRVSDCKRSHKSVFVLSMNGSHLIITKIFYLIQLFVYIDNTNHRIVTNKIYNRLKYSLFLLRYINYSLVLPRLFW